MDTQDQSGHGVDEPAGASLATISHRLYIGAGGVTLYNTDRLDDPEDDPRDGRYPDGGLLLLSPGEAVQFARQIVARAVELEAREEELKRQYEQVSQVLLSLFAELWKRRLAVRWQSRPGHLEFDQVLHDAYRRLVQDESGQVGQWYRSTWTDRFSHEQHEALFWRYFHRHYREQLVDQSFEQEEQE